MDEHVYETCRNIEGVMGMFSEELRELDRNTVHLMIDEMQDEIAAQKKILEENEKVLKEQEKAIEEQSKAIEEKDKELQNKDKTISELREMLKTVQTAERNL